MIREEIERTNMLGSVTPLAKAYRGFLALLIKDDGRSPEEDPAFRELIQSILENIPSFQDEEVRFFNLWNTMDLALFFNIEFTRKLHPEGYKGFVRSKVFVPPMVDFFLAVETVHCSRNETALV